ncbi:MAG: class II fructose-bisphosphate aldolase [Patescibacteria group bacterium]|nr:class II fructose-bisphosphate aldolase [Patescibacteria group bacterium]
MKNLRQYLEEAVEKKVAIGHFNISNIEGLWAIFRAAQGLELPVVIGVSEGERAFIGVRQAAALVKSLREEYPAPDSPGSHYPIFLNADHTYSFEEVRVAIDAGFDAVIFDGAKLSLEENIAETKRSVEYAKSRAELEGRDILVEGELGYIGQSSKVLDELPEGAGVAGDDLTKPEEAARYVQETGVDLLAPAVGNVHGVIRGGNPRLNPERVEQIHRVAGVPLVLHGASGSSDEDIKAAIAAGVSLVHVNTELRVAYRDAVKMALQNNPEEVAPYRIMKDSVLAMQKVVEQKLKLFSARG